MPVSKVDSKCFNLSQKIDPFLSLENVGKSNLTPPEFWKEIASSEESVSSYIVCLIAKLISLDSEHGLKPLPGVYKDLVELPVDYSKYKHWSSKPLPTNAKSSALELQFSIIRTIKHLKEWHGYTPNIHLRHMYLRWNLARNYSSDDTKKADGFEESVIKAFSVAQSKEVYNSAVSSPVHQISFKEGVSPMSDKEEFGLVKALVENVYYNHRRAQFGRLPPDQCRLCAYGNDNLSYVRLRHLVSKSPDLLNEAMTRVLNVVKREVSHSQDYGDREVLLPLLQLFRELLTMLSSVDTVDVYQAVIPFYTWPLAHSEFTKRVLDMIMLEGRVRGTTFRRKVMAEQDLGVRLHATKIRQQLVHMMIDTSHPLSRGSLFSEVFNLQQEKQSQQSLQRLIIRNCFKSVLPHDVDVVELEGKLRRLSSETLKRFCLESLEVTERTATMTTEDDPSRFINTEMKKLHTSIKQHAESDEQRDSAVSCSSSDDELQFSEDHLSSFPLPPPFFHTHPLDNSQYPTILVNLREILLKSQQKATPKISTHTDNDDTDQKSSSSVRPFSRTSNTSMDSTGSNNIHEADGSCDPLPNGHVTNGGDHVMSGDQKENGRPTDLQLTNGQLSQDSSTISPINESPKTVASSTSSDTMSGKISNSIHSHDSLSQEEEVKHRTNPKLLERRQTYAAGMLPSKRVSVSSNSSLSASSPSNSSRRYTNTAGHPQGRAMSIGGNSPMGSLRIQLRKSTSHNVSVKRRPKTSVSTVASPTYKPNLKLIKVVLAGNDILVSHTAKAYAYLRMEEPNLFSGLELRFYHVPLSRASTIHGIEMGGASAALATPHNPDLPEPMFEQVDLSGNDVHIGRFLAHMDSWYERNLMIAVHHLLRLLPSDVPYDSQKMSALNHRPLSPMATEGEGTQSLKTATTPAKILVDTVSQYTQEATNCIHMKLFRVKMSLKSERTNKIEHREMIMLHRLDIQRLSGKKQSNRQVKPFEANITMTELTLDNGLRRSDMMEMTGVWAVRASNIPRAGDTGVPNPETESFELTIVKAQAEGGRFSSTKHRFQEESLHHSCDLVLETRDKPLTVMVDNDLDMLVENVIRIEVSPAYLDQSFRSGVTTSLATRRNDFRLEQHIDFPLMTYWPIDL